MTYSIDNVQASFLLFPLLLACSSEQGGENGTKSDAVQPTAEREWLLYEPDRSHLLIALKEAGSTSSTNRLLIMDFGSGDAPSGLPTKWKDAEILDDGKGVKLIPQTGNEAAIFRTNGSSSIAGHAIPSVVGISQMTDIEGWSLVLSTSLEDGSVSEAKALKVLSQAMVQLKACPSGGTGSSSCSTSGGGTSCTVTCNSGYYACCGYGGVSCWCIKNGKKEPE